MQEYMNVISLISLIFAIGAGYFLKLNTGLLSIAMALIIGMAGGMTNNQIIAGFSGSLFVMLLGVNYMFSIANQNGTLELIAKKIVALAGNHTWLIPIVVFWVAVVLAAIGPGTIPVMALMAVFTMALAAEMKINPVMLAAMGLLGAQGGGLTPFAPTGILGLKLAADQGITGIETTLAGGQCLGSFLYAMVVYAIFKGYAIKSDMPVKFSEIDKFNRVQWITIAGILLMVVQVMILKVNPGLASFLSAGLIMLFRVADERKAIAAVPWATLILVCGVNVLMNVVIKLGGIDLLAKTLAQFMNERTAVPIIGLTAGIMSWFSSTSGVVMPTLIPTVSGILQMVGGNISAGEMITAIVTTAHTAGVSPISTGGALALAAYVSDTQASPEEQQRLFVRMFAVAIGGVIFQTIFAYFGGFRIIP